MHTSPNGSQPARRIRGEEHQPSQIVETAQTRKQLDELAIHFARRRTHLLKAWRRASARNPALAINSSLTRAQFDDHIPGVLDAYAARLRTWPGEETVSNKREEKEQVKQHGLVRWQQGYQLRELTREWGTLQVCLMEELESYAASHPALEPEVMPTARRGLSTLCWNGISDSVTHYWQLHKTEAAGRVGDLEGALAALSKLGQMRAEGWREAAHDLRGSISVVKDAASLLQGDQMPELARSRVSDVLQQSVSFLHEMLTDMMDLARLEAGQEQRHVAPFDAALLLTDFCTTSLSLAHARGLFLKMQGPASLPVEGDRGKVQRILQNLLLNALKYTRRGGVTVSWGAVENCEPPSWMFYVQDSGPGLDAGPAAPLAQKIHEATQTAHDSDHLPQAGENAGESPLAAAPTVAARSETLPHSQIPGEGIGLSIVKRLCELLDASLELETSPGEGSTFRVVLPSQYIQNKK